MDQLIVRINCPWIGGSNNSGKFLGKGMWVVRLSRNSVHPASRAFLKKTKRGSARSVNSVKYTEEKGFFQPPTLPLFRWADYYHITFLLELFKKTFSTPSFSVSPFENGFRLLVCRGYSSMHSAIVWQGGGILKNRTALVISSTPKENHRILMRRREQWE